jgi:AcrR family transcriptional regulator
MISEHEVATKQRIARAALSRLAIDGPGRLTVAGVAAQAKVARGTVYRYFDGKDALLGGVAEHLAEQLVASLEANVRTIGVGSSLARVVDGRLTGETRRQVELLRERHPGFLVEFVTAHHDAYVAAIRGALAEVYGKRDSLGPMSLDVLAELLARIETCETLVGADRTVSRQILLALSRLVDDRSAGQQRGHSRKSA